MSLGCARREGESWRECAARYGRAWGLEREVLEYFDRFVAEGDAEARACWGALLEWDCLDYRDEAAAP